MLQVFLDLPPDLRPLAGVAGFLGRPLDGVVVEGLVVGADDLRLDHAAAGRKRDQLQGELVASQ